MTSTDTRPSLDQAVLLLGAVYAYADEATKMKARAREAILGYLRAGSRMPIVDPRDGADLGSLTVTKPKPSAEVFDEGALVDHIETLYPEAVSTVVDVLPGRDDEVIDVLAEHAPHLLAYPRRVATDWAVTEAKKSAEKGDMVPGVAVRTKRGVPSLRAAEGSLDRYRELVAAGQVDPLAELPPATGGQA